MNIREAYDSWASQYDTNNNKTRDLEGVALRQTLKPLAFDSCLEIGCGTGKNTEWLAQKASSLTAVDFSEEMLQKAKQKSTAQNVNFVQADITHNWYFINKPVDLVCFSLVLEHLQLLAPTFKRTASALKSGGLVYIGELHPFKQYSGSKASFETSQGKRVLTCFSHHISDFLTAAEKHELELIQLKEFFDSEEETIPRILVLLFRKK